MVESSLGIVGACLPLFRPIVNGIYPIRSIREIISFSSRSHATAEKAFVNARTLENGGISSTAASSNESIHTGDHIG